MVKSNLTRNKRHEILLRMGYIVHPAFKTGRTDHPVRPDDKRAKLYVRSTDTMLSQLKSGAAAKHYEDANKDVFPASFPVDHSVSSMNIPRPQ